MFFEFVNAVLTLDVDWLAWLLFANFHYLFAFAALCFFFFEGKTRAVVISFCIFCCLAWAFYDFTDTSGWLFFVGGFLALNYIMKVSLLTFSAYDPRLSKYLLVINWLSAYVLMAIYNLFLVG